MPSTPTSALLDALQRALSSPVLSAFPDRLAYARDCWPRNTLRVRDGDTALTMPLYIVQPHDEDEVAEIVRIAERFGAPLVPYGAGSGVCGGAIPLSDGAITVDLKLLRCFELDAEQRRLRVGPGAIGQHVETALLRRGFTLGHYPSSLYCSSIGGYVATRSAGQYSSRYGKIEDMVESMRVVVGGGEVVDTAELDRHGGPELLPLLLGSEGTLGVITDTTLRVHPAPEHRDYRGWIVPNIDAGLRGIRQLMRAGLRPTVVRLYDEPDTLLGHRDPGRSSVDEPPAAPGLFKRLLSRASERLEGAFNESALSAIAERASRALMGRALGHPLMINRLVDALPSNALMIVGFEGSRAEVDAESQIAHEILARHGEDAGPEPGEHWYETRFKVSYKMSPTLDTGAFVDTMEVATTWSNLRPLYRAVRSALAPYAVTLAHFSHAYPDGCSIYFTFASFAPNPPALLRLYDQTWSAALEAVAQSGAAVTHHHGVGLLKAPYVPRDQLGGRPLFDRLKRTFDPHGVLNPGKVWLTTEEETRS